MPESTKSPAEVLGAVPMITGPILDRAANLLEQSGAWRKGHLCHGKDGYPCYGAVTGADFCATAWSLVGSLQKAAWLQARDDENATGARLISYHRLVPDLARLVASAVGVSKPEHIVDWEDAPGRTQAEVVAALREAARQASIRGGEA